MPITIYYYFQKRRNKKQHFCQFCSQKVLNFARHLTRRHRNEDVVRKMLHMNANNIERKKLIASIRKQGNFFISVKENIVHPVLKPQAQTFCDNFTVANNKYVTCPGCLGFYQRRYLKRHRRLCCTKTESTEKEDSKQKCITESEVLVFKEFYNSLEITNNIFKTMRCDEISTAAVKDILICIYAENLLQKYRHKSARIVIKNKMRDLGRLLLELNNMIGVQNLFEAMKPNLFDDIVAATKIISGYDPENGTVQKKKFALRMGRTLRSLCQIATEMIIKESPFLQCENREKSFEVIKELSNLILYHWNYKFSLAMPEHTVKSTYSSIENKPQVDDTCSIPGKLYITITKRTLLEIYEVNKLQQHCCFLTIRTIFLTFLKNVLTAKTIVDDIFIWFLGKRKTILILFFFI